jgi:hypothetical protein
MWEGDHGGKFDNLQLGLFGQDIFGLIIANLVSNLLPSKYDMF